MSRRRIEVNIDRLIIPRIYGILCRPTTGKIEKSITFELMRRTKNDNRKGSNPKEERKGKETIVGTNIKDLRR